MRQHSDNRFVSGSHAVLGVDVVDFSLLSNENQVQFIQHLLSWIRAALAYHGIDEGAFRWSPAGDGGYITFVTPAASEAAMDVGCSVMEKANRDPWGPKGQPALLLRCAIHSGLIQESEELGGTTNIWGEGINMTSRILGVCAAAQILISESYYQTYVRGKPSEKTVRLSGPFHRTVKHGVHVLLRNVSRGDLGVPDDKATHLRWLAIGTLWQNTTAGYELLIADCMHSNSPVAALAAAKFLLCLNPVSRSADSLFRALHSLDNDVSVPYPKQHHTILGHFSPGALRLIAERSEARFFDPGEWICRERESAQSCFFHVFGRVEVELNIEPRPIISPGAILGEFGLWIPGMKRTASLKAVDHCMLLELPFDAFNEAADSHPEIRETLATVIRQRIVANIVGSREYFPDIVESDRESILKPHATCRKFEAGNRLDLGSASHVLFSGRVSLSKENQRLVVSASGRFGDERVLGIATEHDRDSLDGAAAEVLEEAVVVTIPHEVILKLQQRYPAVESAWNGLWGKRLGEFKRTASAGRTTSR